MPEARSFRRTADTLVEVACYGETLRPVGAAASAVRGCAPARGRAAPASPCADGRRAGPAGGRSGRRAPASGRQCPDASAHRRRPPVQGRHRRRGCATRSRLSTADNCSGARSAGSGSRAPRPRRTAPPAMPRPAPSPAGGPRRTRAAGGSPRGRCVETRPLGTTAGRPAGAPDCGTLPQVGTSPRATRGGKVIATRLDMLRPTSRHDMKDVAVGAFARDRPLEFR